ncbi:MAG: L,D-transpeptidase family protein [Lachnospiraceae bacterium]|nr:L,D-transpeptidase family protein [Lachnospiraceae bacterium]
MKKSPKVKHLIVATMFALCGIVSTAVPVQADTVIDAQPQQPDTPRPPATTETSETTEQTGQNEPTTTTVDKGWNEDKTCYYVNGTKVTGIQKIQDKLYYFDGNGNLIKKTGLKKVKGTYYYFNSNYSLRTGVVKIKKKLYYFKQTDGSRYEETGINKVDGKTFMFGKKHNLLTGWRRDENNMRYYFDKKAGAALVGWNYVGKYKYYFNKKGQLSQDVRKKLTKKQKSSYMIKVNRTACCVTVYAKDGDKGYTIPVIAFVCSTGPATPVGNFTIRDRLRWHELMGPSWGQWCEHLTEDILFHSVYYNEKNNNRTLDVSAYNKLGKMASHGCVRLTAGDAKWIYDNCSIGTKVTIYNDKKNPGPFDKPKAVKLKSSHTWDPTDPTIK